MMVDLIIIGLLIFPFLAGQINDPDLFWHMSCGKELLSTGTVDCHKWYYSAVNPTISSLSQTWLGDCVLYIVHTIGGEVALQIFRAELIVIMLWLMWESSNKKLDASKMFVVGVVTLSCFQLQLLRNSLFSMPFVSLVWWMWLNKIKYRHALSCLLIVIWSQMHGSYMLGVGIFGILFTCEVFEKNKFIGLVILALTAYYISTKIQGAPTLNLNGTLFKVASEGASRDFMSPFLLNRVYFKACLALSIFYTAMIKKPRIAYILPFIATLIPALGYTRMIGYHAITCGFLLSHAMKNNDLRQINKMLYFFMCIIVGFTSWMQYSNNIGIGFNRHYKAIHGVSFYQPALSSESLAAYYYFMYGIKGYWDTFYAPHPDRVRENYLYFLRHPDKIPEQIRTCIVSGNESKNFNGSKIWKLKFYKDGVYVFIR